MEELEIAIDSLVMTEIDRFRKEFSTNKIRTILLMAFVVAMEKLENASDSPEMHMNAIEDLKSGRLCVNFSTRKIWAVVWLAFGRFCSDCLGFWIQRKAADPQSEPTRPVVDLAQ